MGNFEIVGSCQNINLLENKIDTNFNASPEIAKLYGKHYIMTWVDSLANGSAYENVIYISENIEDEKKINLKLNTKVRAIYPD